MKILEGKVSIVTGAGSGMGRAIAKIYAREGSFVVVADVNLKTAEETVKLIEDAGGKGCAVLVDVTKEEDIKKMFDCAIEKFGTVDILVNNAGIMDNFEPAEDMTDELWDKVFAVNTTSVMRTTRRALPIFKEKGKGVIINITSAGGLYGSRAGAAYTASKHAVTEATSAAPETNANSSVSIKLVIP
jgi:NAD(P)-dependent dehydrogenase (short-subunit alcohol dehydrogenase family)